MMAKILKMAQLVDQYGVPQMQVGCRWIETSFDAQRPTLLELVDKFAFHQQFVTAAFDVRKLGLNVHHNNGIMFGEVTIIPVFC